MNPNLQPLINPTTSFTDVTPVSFFFCVKGRRDDCFAESFLPFLKCHLYQTFSEAILFLSEF
jgi:hypothetical protein